MAKNWGGMKRFRGPKEQLDAARSPDRSADELDVLAESQYNFVQTAVAEHPNTKGGTLAELVPMSLEGGAEQYLGAALARNANTPNYALERLGSSVAPYLRNERGQHVCFEIGVALSCHPQTPIEVLKILVSEEQSATVFRKVVARETRREDVLKILERDRSEAVRKQAAITLRELEAREKE